ncbi:hypothetical protein BaRGS_00033471 [Batillaria attramentaria]|uniref:Uncharacterized protein n=1 Tax=Batillaria attramentaria TaxID=370345 RepID=A0ABD0JK16_9CAEN
MEPGGAIHCQFSALSTGKYDRTHTGFPRSTFDGPGEGPLLGPPIETRSIGTADTGQSIGGNGLTLGVRLPFACPAVSACGSFA